MKKAVPMGTGTVPMGTGTGGTFDTYVSNVPPVPVPIGILDHFGTVPNWLLFSPLV
jgi:hypothetical protein